MMTTSEFVTRILGLTPTHWQAFLLDNLSPPINMLTTTQKQKLPKTALPDVYYQYDFMSNRWQYMFDVHGSPWTNSNAMCTGDDECLTKVRKNFEARNVIFLHDPRDAAWLREPLAFPAYAVQTEATPVRLFEPTPKRGKVFYRFNTERLRWEFSMHEKPHLWIVSDTLGPRHIDADPFVLTDDQLARLKDDWKDTDVVIEPLDPAKGYYRFNVGRWEYYSSTRGWRPSFAYGGLTAAQGVERIDRDHAINGLSGNIFITSIDGVAYPKWRATRKAAALGAAYGATESTSARAQASANMYEGLGDIYGHVSGRAFTTEQPPIGSPIRVIPKAELSGDIVLIDTERQRFNRIHDGRQPIPLEREWLDGSGTLVDLKTVGNEHLSNIVNMVVRGARASGPPIARTPERVRQGLNAARELAERIERMEWRAVKAESNEKAVRESASNVLNAFKTLKRLVDPTETPDNGAKHVGTKA